MNVKLVRYTDGIYVIEGAHLTLEEAKKLFEKEYDEVVDAYDFDKDCEIISGINKVTHCWIRYEFVGEFNCPDDFDFEPGDAIWLLYTTKNRPKGVTRKATIINYDNYTGDL